MITCFYFLIMPPMSIFFLIGSDPLQPPTSPFWWNEARLAIIQSLFLFKVM
jgi:hypothetical protein